MIFDVHVAIQANLEPALEPAGSPREEQCCSSSSTRTCSSISPIHLPSQVLGLARLTAVVAVGNRNSTPLPLQTGCSSVSRHGALFSFRWQGLAWVQRRTGSSSLTVHTWQDASSCPPFPLAVTSASARCHGAACHCLPPAAELLSHCSLQL